MQAIKNINVDLTNLSVTPLINAKQNDRDARYIQFTVHSGSVPFVVPSGVSAMFRYKKQDGTGGFYDTNEAGQPAIVISGSTVTVQLVEQVLTVAGAVSAELNFYSAAGEKLTTFTLEIMVEASVLTDATIVSSDYYNILTAQVAAALLSEQNAAASAAAAAASAQRAEELSQQSKGWFATSAALIAAYPTGQPGWWAIVGAGDNIWTWDTDTSAWVNTHTQTDLSNYYTKTQADGRFATTAQGAKADTAVQPATLDASLVEKGISTYVHARTGTVNSLTLSGGGNNIKFVATANNASGDTWTVNGVSVTAKDEGGNDLSADSIAIGQTIRCALNGTSLTFSSGGSGGTVGLQMVKLWDNPNPTASFPTQIVNIPANIYDYIVFFVRPTTQDESGSTYIAYDGTRTRFPAMQYNGFQGSRTVIYTKSDGTIDFSGGGGSSGAADDTKAIPVFIYGVKGVQ